MPEVNEAALLARRPRPQFAGKFRGRVINNIDPLQQGRLQATLPDVLGNEVSGWALPCAPYAGIQAGLFAIPPIGANVWMEFEAGDPSRPIWTGGWWDPGELPPENAGAAPSPDLKILRTTAGLMLALDDSQTTLTLSDAEGQNQIVIDLRQGVITLKGAARVIIEGPLIQEGSSSSAHPAVLGDQLLAYLNELVTIFNLHVHPGQTPTPPVPALAPPPPDLLSTKVKLE
jgi:Type VI secretion system/phage-baseplate injector OB domain